MIACSTLALTACEGGNKDVSDEQEPAQSAAVIADESMPSRLASEALAFGPATMTGRPAYRVPTTETGSETIITRISGAEIAPGGGSVRHGYARNQPWNADGTLLMLSFGYPAAIVDARNMEFQRWVHQPMNAVWSHLDPNFTIGTLPDTNQLVRADMRIDGAIDVVRTFGDYTEISFGAGEGNLSNDDRYVALFGFGGGNTDLFVYDLTNDQIVARSSFGTARVCDCADPGSINNATMSQSGRYVLVQYNERGLGRSRGIEVFDLNLQFLRQLTQGSEHGDVGLTADGVDVWVSWHDTTQNDPLQNAAAYAWRMDSGAATAVIPNGTTLGHISCRNTRWPGYCFASHANANDSRVWGSDTLYAFPLNGSMQMEFFAHQYSSSATYERLPMGVPNREGTAALWASDWLDNSAPVYAYVATPAAQ